MYTKKAIIGIFLVVSLPSLASAFEGGDGSSTDPYEISTCQQLQNIRDNVSANYELVSDVDCSSTRYWNSGHGFEPITPTGRNFVDSNGDLIARSYGGPFFNGTLDGNSYTIEDIYIQNSTLNGVGVIGGMRSPGKIVNININNATISGHFSVGSIIGNIYGGENLEDVSATGNISGEKKVGGIVGKSSIRLKNLSSNVNASGDSKVGGIVGVSGGNISDSHSTGSISGSTSGGIVGEALEITLKESYSNAKVNSYFSGGGLVGIGAGSLTIENSYATGDISGNSTGSSTRNLGGIIGKTNNGVSVVIINNSYSTSDVNGNFYEDPNYDFRDSSSFGGIVGSTNSENLTIGNSYSAGNVTGRNSGGVIGSNSGFAKSNLKTIKTYWDVDSSGQTTSIGTSTGLNTNEMQGPSASSNMTGLDFSGIWTTTHSYPKLRWQLPPGDGSSSDPYQISTCSGLQEMQNDLSGNYVLVDDVDCSSHEGFSSVGNRDNPFTGTLAGRGHEVYDLTISEESSEYVGLIGYMGVIDGDSKIKNITLDNINVSGYFNVGGLVGYKKWGNISKAYAIGNVSGNASVGGLVGVNSNLYIGESWSAATVEGKRRIGGLVGKNDDHIIDSFANGSVSGESQIGGLTGYSYGSTSNAHASGNVSGTENVGGLIGQTVGRADINGTYSTGNVEGVNNVGGLVGSSPDGFFNPIPNISRSYSTGVVTGANNVGGLLGQGTGDLTIKNSYSLSDVSGDSNVGGLIGLNIENSGASHVFVAGNVTGNSNVGGLIGNNTNPEGLADAYWNVEVSGQSSSNGGIGLNTLEMLDGTPRPSCEGTMSGLDFNSIFYSRDKNYPGLRFFASSPSNSRCPILDSKSNSNTVKGALWVQNSDLHWGTGSTEYFLKDAFELGGVSGPPGAVWIQGDSLRWIDEIGTERSYVGRRLSVDQTSSKGALWFQNGFIHYIDENGDERVADGT